MQHYTSTTRIAIISCNAMWCKCHMHTMIFRLPLSRFRQYTSAQRDIALLDREMVSRGRWQGTSQGASCIKSKVPFPVSWHIAGSSVSRIFGISENWLRIAMREIGTRHRRQGEGRHRNCLGSGDATREKGTAIPRWSRHDGHSSNRSAFSAHKYTYFCT